MNKNLIRSADSPSLWNCALAPGWTKEELEILRLAIMKFGLGSWTKIMRSHCLPKKTFGQLNLQTQRMMGQQSLGEFMGIHLDVKEVWFHNQKKQGPEYIRKSGLLVNAGNNPTREQRLAKIEANRIKFELSKEQIEAIVLPVGESHDAEALKRDKLKQLKETLAYMEQRLEKLEKDVSTENTTKEEIKEPSSQSSQSQRSKYSRKRKIEEQIASEEEEEEDEF